MVMAKWTEVDKDILERRAVSAMKNAITNIVRGTVIYIAGETHFEIWSIQPDMAVVVIELRTTGKLSSAALEKAVLGYFIKTNRFFNRNVEYSVFLNLLSGGYFEVYSVKTYKMELVKWLVERPEEDGDA